VVHLSFGVSIPVTLGITPARWNRDEVPASLPAWIIQTTNALCARLHPAILRLHDYPGLCLASITSARDFWDVLSVPNLRASGRFKDGIARQERK
jgi:hypothetical protein